MFSSVLSLYFVRPIPRLGGSHPSVRPPCPVLDSLHRHPTFWLLTGTEGPGHQTDQPGADNNLQGQPGPLQVGSQPCWPGGRRRLGVRGRYKPEWGGGEARRWHGVSAEPGSLESLPECGSGVWVLWRRSHSVLTSCWRQMSLGAWGEFGTIQIFLLISGEI